MTIEQECILNILSCALRNEKYSFSPLASMDWNEFIIEIQKQGVCALCYYSTEKESIPEEFNNQWKYFANRDIVSNVRVTDAHAKVCRLMEKNGILAVCLKGYASAFYYSHPEYRAMGDSRNG